jgi:hypothetical protein
MEDEKWQYPLFGIRELKRLSCLSRQTLFASRMRFKASWVTLVKSKVSPGVTGSR